MWPRNLIKYKFGNQHFNFNSPFSSCLVAVWEHYLGLLLHVREIWQSQRIMMADSRTGPISLQTPDTASSLKTLKHFPCPANLTHSRHLLDQVARSRSHIKIFKAGEIISNTLPMSGAAWLTHNGHTRLSRSRLGRGPIMAGPISARLPPPAANQRTGLWAENWRETLISKLWTELSFVFTSRYDISPSHS